MLAPLLFLLQAATTDTIHVNINGADRLAYVCAPSKPSTAGSPVVFMFHGHGGSAQRCMQRFQMEKQWPEALVVYCDGLATTTAGGDGQGWQVEAQESNRDIKFFDALLPKVLTQYHGDPKKVFAWGFSNGGMFMYTLWTLRADKFAGFCASGSCFATDDIHLDNPKPVFITISANDPIVPPNLQEDAFESILKTDRSEKSGTSYGDAGTYFKGAAPVVVWRYKGGHEFPFESFPKLIEFFKSMN
jgi:polyhydroxybutyrate depolymerase